MQRAKPENNVGKKTKELVKTETVCGREWYVVFECQATGFRTTDIRKLFRERVRKMGSRDGDIKVFHVKHGMETTKPRCMATLQP
jgi:hypothetical protein